MGGLIVISQILFDGPLELVWDFMRTVEDLEDGDHTSDQVGPFTTTKPFLDLDLEIIFL